MGAEAKAIGILDLNCASFDQAIATAKKALAGLAVAFSAVKIEQFFVGGAQEAINFGNEAFKASQKLGGFDPGKLLLVDKALENAGLSASEAQAKVGEFISSKRDLSQIFGGAEQYAKALQAAGQVYGSQANILSSKAEAFAKVFQTLEEVGGKLKTFFLAATGEFLEPLESVLEALNAIDLAGVGKSFGDAIAIAVEGLAGLFKEGKFISTLQDAFVIGVKTAIEYAVGGVKYVSALLVEEVNRALTEIPWKDVGSSVLLGLVQIGDFLLTIMEKAAAALGAGLAWAIQGMLNIMPAKLRKWLTGGEEKGTETISDLYKTTMKTVNEQAAPIHIKSMVAEEYFGKATKESRATFAPEKLFEGLGKQTDDLKDMFTHATAAGKEMAKTQSHLSKIKINQLALQPAEAFKGIGDSLAKVGGGGGFIRTGLNLQERTQIQQLEVQKATRDATVALVKKTVGGTTKLQ